MSDAKRIENVIASRDLEFVLVCGTRQKATLKVGKPFEDLDGLGWCCPFEISTDLDSRIVAIHGGDALQALTLALKSLPADIEYWEKAKGGHFRFLDEEGAGV